MHKYYWDGITYTKPIKHKEINKTEQRILKVILTKQLRYIEQNESDAYMDIAAIKLVIDHNTTDID